MEYIICYDIEEDKTRSEVANICLNKGFNRIQYSVFYGKASKNKIETILMEIKDVTKGKEAIIFVGQFCEKCAKNKIIFVNEKKKEKDKVKEKKESKKEKKVITKKVESLEKEVIIL